MLLASVQSQGSCATMLQYLTDFAFNVSHYVVSFEAGETLLLRIHVSCALFADLCG